MRGTQTLPERVRARAILLGALLMPIHSYWISRIEAIVYKGGGGSTSSLIWTSVYNMTALVLLSRLARRWRPAWALSRAELLAIFAMFNIAAAVAGHDLIQILVPLIAYPLWHASPENDWAQTLLPFLPDGATVTDRLALAPYFQGESSLLHAEHLRAWLLPVLNWTGFIAVLLIVALGINVLVRKQWTEVDRLSYPVIQLPLHLAAPTRAFMLDPVLWAGFATTALLRSVNNVNRISPSFPRVPMSYDFGGFFMESPWNAVGWLPFNIIPNYIGIGYFVPLDILFSCWFFLLAFKSQMVLGRVMGIRALPGFPYSYEQSSGGYLALGAIALWLTRKHLRRVGGMLVSARGEPEATEYRVAAAAVVLGFVGLVLFGMYLGMGAWVAAAFFGLFYVIQIAIGRMRAEIGTPLHDLHFGGPSTLLVNALGSTRLSHTSLIGLTQMWSVDRAYRSNAVPHQLEGLKLAERVNAQRRGFIIALLVGSALSGVFAFWAMLHQSYEVGIDNAAPVNRWFGYEAWARFQRWTSQRVGTDVPAISFSLVGFVATLGLMVARTRFVWWPFHPLGYAISGSWQMTWGWGSFFIIWAVKLVILKHSGIQGFRRATAYFLGLLMGDVFVGGTWTMVGIGFRLW
ncbi:hypothetical protein CMK11_13005 [Candidatus Poribacteria bacterium]|nr:hypothetical protein [Candidatus Poribacteria bacterium]